MIEEGQAASKGNRIYWLDNLRTFMIFLVVLYHAGLVYERSGILAFVWIVYDPSTNNLSGILNILVDIIVMPTVFLISGFFAPLSLKNKEGWAFLKSRFKRLIIPWIIAVFTLIPLYKIIFLYSRNLPQESWTTYFHFSEENLTSQNWLWFLPVLFLFNILYLLFSKANIRIPNISLKGAVIGTLLIGFVYSASMDIFGLSGWTLTPFIDFQNERLLIYFMAFLLGALCFRLKIFELEWKNKKLNIIIYSTGWIPLTLYILLVLNFVINPGNYIFSANVDGLLLRLNFMIALSYLLYVMIYTFRNYLNKQGKISKELNQNSYYVYIIHVIVVGAIALTMLNTAIPSLFKYLIVTVSTIVASNLIISFFRKVIKSKTPSAVPS